LRRLCASISQILRGLRKIRASFSLLLSIQRFNRSRFNFSCGSVPLRFKVSSGVARFGPEPTLEMNEAFERKFELIEPAISNTVSRTVPWLLSREVTQTQLRL
jgi:hypothetical protein